MMNFSKENLIGQGTSRKVYRCEDKNYIVKEYLKNTQNNQNLIEWNIFKYVNFSKNGWKIKTFLNECISIENNGKYLICPYCEKNNKEISWNIFGTYVESFWDWKNLNNWGILNNQLKLIDYGYPGNIYFLKDLSNFEEILGEIHK